MINRALAEGVDPAEIEKAIIGLINIDTDFGLGIEFARALLENSKQLEPLRREIVSRFDSKALITATFAASTLQAYPLIKRGLGYAQSCSILKFDDQLIEFEANR